jgi:hypothetical protein
MLLSFAQFEREVTGERIRDKIAASKKRGMWMGGVVPLGYGVKDRKLVVSHAEAKTVRHIYRRYAALGSVRALEDELDREGIVSKLRVDRLGRTTGGRRLSRGALYLMLQNRIYCGEIIHRKNSYTGEHDAIVEWDLWEDVQRRLAANRVDREKCATATEPRLVAGLIYDEAGELMTPSHANKKGTRYRYYVSQSLVKGPRRNAPRARRVPAADLEGLVEDRLRVFLTNAADLFGMLESRLSDASQCADLVGRAADLADRWPSLAPTERRGIIIALVDRIDLMTETLEIRILPSRLLAILVDESDRRDRGPLEDSERGIVRSMTLSVPARLRRTGMEIRLIINGSGSARRKPDHSLCRVLAQAHRYHGMVMRAGGKTIAELAAEAGVGGSYFTRILRLSFLAPEVVKAILHNRHPIDLNAKRLVNQTRIPIVWKEHRALLEAD